VLVALAACGGGDDDRMEMPAPPPAAAPAAAVEEEETVETRISAMMATNERATFSVDTRDPFSPPRPDVVDINGPSGGPEIDCILADQPLGQTPVEELELIGLITGTSVPRAMFVSDGTRQAIMVTEGSLVGPNCTNRITNIRDNEVVIEPRTVGETQASPIILVLNDDRLAQRFIQIEDE
jgi:Tfp pilus assembly protein PilP